MVQKAHRDALHLHQVRDAGEHSIPENMTLSIPCPGCSLNYSCLDSVVGVRSKEIKTYYCIGNAQTNTLLDVQEQLSGGR